MENKYNKSGFIRVDDWIPSEEDKIIKCNKYSVIMPIYDTLTNTNGNISEMINHFSVNHPKKRLFAVDKGKKTPIKMKMIHYLNYFIKFYDEDKQLLNFFSHIKFLIDYTKEMSYETLISYTMNFITSEPFYNKVRKFNEDSYYFDIEKGSTSIKNTSILFVNEHAKLLMEFSFMMTVAIFPILHKIIVNRNIEVTALYNFADSLINYYHSRYNINIYIKIYDYFYYRVESSKRKNIIWETQGIRGITQHDFIDNSIKEWYLHIVPKYTYNDSVTNLSFAFIKNTINNKVTKANFEMTFINHSSSIRDEDNNSEFDKYESNLIKIDESLLLQTNVNAKETMKTLEQKYGRITSEEIEHYANRLSEGQSTFNINSFQKELIFNLFYKEFGDEQSIRCINKTDFVKLMIFSKRVLLQNTVILPYIVSSKIISLPTRNFISKAEKDSIERDEEYQQIMKKYMYMNDEKIKEIITRYISSILDGTFEIIDYDNKELDGRIIPQQYIRDVISYEIKKYILMI